MPSMATERETVAQFMVWRHKKHETVTKVVVLALAEPETVSSFTAWVAGERETVVEPMARSLQSLRLLQNSWHAGRRA